MFREMRRKIIGLTKGEQMQLAKQQELLELEAREKKLKSELTKKLEDLEKKFYEEFDAFCDEYMYDFSDRVEKGYWVQDLEEEWYIGDNSYEIPFGFPYICFSNKHLKRFRLMINEILEIKNQLGPAIGYISIYEQEYFGKFESIEKLYNHTYEKQKQFCIEKFQRDKFNALELGKLDYFEIFDGIMNADSWTQVFKLIKDYNTDIKLQVQKYNNKITELNQLIENPPILWLSLEEKNNYFSNINYEEIDIILNDAIKMSQKYDAYSDVYFKNLKKYTNAIRLSDRMGLHKSLKEQFMFYAIFRAPIFKEGINWPEITTSRNYINYDIYENLPKYNDVFYKYPYNLYSKSLYMFESEYYKGHLFIGRLIKGTYWLDIDYLSNTDKDHLRAGIDFAKEVKLQHKNEGKGVAVGIEGEEQIRVEFDKFDDCTINLYNIRLENDGMSIETDCIIIAPNGIFSIEVKNLGSNGQYELVVTKDGQWRKVNKNKNIDEPYNDVFQQTMNHVNGTRRLLKHKIQDKENSILKNKDIYIQPIVVLANNQVSIDNSSEQVILRASGVFNYIFNTYSSKMTLNHQEMEEIRDILLEESLQSKKYPVTDYLKIVQSIVGVINEVNSINGIYSKKSSEINEIILKDESQRQLVDEKLGLAELYYADLYIENNFSKVKSE